MKTKFGMKKKYFGTDGIRGRVKKFPIVEDFFFKNALSLVRTKRETKKVLIGKDTRISGAYIEKALRDGFKLMKVNCDFIGVVSTPIVSFYTKFFKYDFGIMISASHNPYYDNGIKIFKKNGQKLSDEEEIIIERKIDRVKTIYNISNSPISYKKFEIKIYKNFLTKNLKNLIYQV